MGGKGSWEPSWKTVRKTLGKQWEHEMMGHKEESKIHIQCSHLDDELVL